jgi:hypothetical protein
MCSRGNLNNSGGMDETNRETYDDESPKELAALGFQMAFGNKVDPSAIYKEINQEG